MDLNALGPAYDSTLPTPKPEEDEMLEYWYNPDVAPNPEVWVTNRLVKRHVGAEEYALLQAFPPPGGLVIKGCPKGLWDSVPDVNKVGTGGGGGPFSMNGTVELHPA